MKLVEANGNLVLGLSMQERAVAVVCGLMGLGMGGGAVWIHVKRFEAPSFMAAAIILCLGLLVVSFYYLKVERHVTIRPDATCICTHAFLKWRNEEEFPRFALQVKMTYEPRTGAKWRFYVEGPEPESRFYVGYVDSRASMTEYCARLAAFSGVEAEVLG